MQITLTADNPKHTKMALKLAYKILTDSSVEKKYAFTALGNADGAKVYLGDAQDIVKKTFQAIVEQEEAEHVGD